MLETLAFSIVLRLNPNYFMKKLLLISGLLLSALTANAQVTFTIPAGGAIAGGDFYLAYDAAELTGTLTSIDVNLTLTASTNSTYANDFAIVVLTGFTATDELILQSGGYSDFGFDEHIQYTTGNAGTAGTTVNETVTLAAPIDFGFNPTYKIYFGNGYGDPTASGTWTGTFTLNGVTSLGTKQNAAAAAFSVFPNPANNVINVANANTKITGVSLTDLNGRTVKNVTFDSLSNVQVNIDDLASGMYMMTIKSAEGEAVKKVMKK